MGPSQQSSCASDLLNACVRRIRAKLYHATSSVCTPARRDTSRPGPWSGDTIWPTLGAAWASAGSALQRGWSAATLIGRSGDMRTTMGSYFNVIAMGVAALFIAGTAHVSAQQAVDGAIRIGGSDLGGVVTSANGPEAGVWVIAETTELPTRFIKIVVTDDHGRYVLPELPKANFSVWVRGYGLVDSPKVRTTPGKLLDLRAVVAPNAAAAAEYYPAIYWYSMLRVPEKSEFPGTGPQGNGMPVTLKSQAQWLDVVKTNGCYTCHQLGNKATRTIPKELGQFNSSVEAWARRIVSGQAMTQMANNIKRLDPERAYKLFADWTDRIAAGELPASKPTRPRGVERNVVITLWDWAGPKDYLHDEISTDKRKPTVNANGLIYGATEESTDLFPVLDPVKHKATQVKMLVRAPNTPSSKQNPMTPSPYWGPEPIWDSQTSMHNPMFDERGRVWFTSRVGAPSNPDFCKKGSEHPSAKLFAVEQSNRHLSMYDPKTGKITLIRTCFPTHHLVFAEDANNTLWTSAGGPGSGGIGWLKRKMVAGAGYGPRGMDIDRQGVVWTPLSSGHLASFDRRRCKGPLNGPTATGQHCPEGWTLYPFPGPQLQNVTDSGSAEASYYTWVDQFDTFGLGRNVPIATGNANEALLAFVNGAFVNLRVPYPMGFYAKWMDGRIDDPKAGWKGKALFSTYATRTPFHVEGGPGTTSKVVKFQLRPDPLAR